MNKRERTLFWVLGEYNVLALLAVRFALRSLGCRRRRKHACFAKDLELVVVQLTGARVVRGGCREEIRELGQLILQLVNFLA